MPEESLNRTAAMPHLSADVLPASDGSEGAAMWVAAPFQALIRGVDASRDRFEVAAVLDTLSTGGLYVRLDRPAEPGATVFVVVRLSTRPEPAVPAPSVAARGRVAEVQRQADGVYGVAISFARHRFLYTRI